MRLCMGAIFLDATIWFWASCANFVQPHVNALSTNRWKSLVIPEAKASADFAKLLFAVNPPGTRHSLQSVQRARRRSHSHPVLTEKALGLSTLSAKITEKLESDARREEETVLRAITNVSRDMNVLDNLTSRAPQLSTFDVSILAWCLGVSYGAPFAVAGKVVEILVPVAGAICAAVGFSAEYIGKVAVARGKEIAATTLKAAAEAEELLAQAEREKAIIPLCVGVSASAAAFALIMPAIFSRVAKDSVAALLVTPITLIAPLIAALSARLAQLACQQSIIKANNAIGLGARRFATADRVGRSWKSATEQIEESSARSMESWKSLYYCLLPAPAIASFFPGGLSLKAVVASAIYAAQAAYSLASAEYVLSVVVESVAKKARAAAVADTYANQGARAGSILPFTSALSGLSAALTVAVVEYIDVLPSIFFIPSVFSESLACGLFPSFGALLASAACISKAQCEVDADAAFIASQELADSDKVPRFDRFSLAQKTLELLRMSMARLRIRKKLSKVLPIKA
mmetsp:Transcript_41473/g.65774  ORF Transcript_41473/g.65774 Transcript_41473/m.65774 type:complete len:518 (-) Transcript_41473:161-1714(-)